MDGRKLSISPKVIAVIAVVLIVVVGIAAWLNADNIKGHDDTQITVCLDGEEKAVFAMSELADMEVDSVYAEFTSKKAEGEKGTWSGVWVTDLLDAAGIEPDQYETVMFSAGDGYSSAADYDEVPTVMIAWEKDGEALEPFEDGGTGPMRCIFSKESFGQRCIHNVVKINCKP